MAARSAHPSPDPRAPARAHLAFAAWMLGLGLLIAWTPAWFAPAFEGGLRAYPSQASLVAVGGRHRLVDAQPLRRLGETLDDLGERPACDLLDLDAAYRLRPGTLARVRQGYRGDACFVTHDPLPGWALLALGRPLDLNAVDVRDLAELPGLGPKLAARIVEARTRRGGFTSVDDLLAVKGVGAKALARIRPYVELRGAP